MPTFNASPGTVSEIAAGLASAVALWIFKPPKDQMAQVVGLTAGSTYFLSKWVIEQDTGLFDLFEEGLTFASSAPGLFALMWGGLIAVSYLEVLVLMGLALFSGAEEILLPVIEFLKPIRWILNPFSLNYAMVIIPTTFLIACIFSPVCAYPVLAGADALNITALKPLGVTPTDPAAGLGGRGDAYGWVYLPQDLIQLFLSYPLAAYGAGEALRQKKFLPLLTFPITGMASLFHRVGDVIYDLFYWDSKGLVKPCMGHWFDRPPVILDPSFDPLQYNNTCDPATLTLTGAIEGEITSDLPDLPDTKKGWFDTAEKIVGAVISDVV